MKTTIAGLALAGLAFSGLLLGAGGTETAGGAGETDVAKNPALLISPSVKISQVSVHGVKLGDPIEKLAKNLAFTRQDIPERPQDTIYAGRDTWYFANEGKIYRIRVVGEIAKQIPTYDAARLQMALGKADEVAEGRSGEDTRVSFFGRRVQYTVHAFRTLSVVTEVDLYAP